MAIVFPEREPKRAGKRIQVLPGSEGFDAFDWLIVREKDGGNWYISTVGWITPVIPILLGLACPPEDLDACQALVRPPAEHWLECMQRWVQEEEHRKQRERLRQKTGVRRWNTRADVARALVLAPEELIAPLKLMAKDRWIWRFSES